MRDISFSGPTFSGARSQSLVSEPGACLLPLALRAPEIAVLHPVDLATLFRFPADPPWRWHLAHRHCQQAHTLLVRLELLRPRRQLDVFHWRCLLWNKSHFIINIFATVFNFQFRLNNFGSSQVYWSGWTEIGSTMVGASSRIQIIEYSLMHLCLLVNVKQSFEPVTFISLRLLVLIDC